LTDSNGVLYPPSTYPTTAADNGAEALYDSNFYLGSNVDFDEVNGVPTAQTNSDATADDSNVGGKINSSAPAGSVDNGVTILSNGGHS